MSASNRFVGNKWQSMLVYVHYDERGAWSRNWYNQNHLENLPNGLTSPKAAPEALAGNVIKISAYTTDLRASKCFKTFERMLTHHFIIVETDNGFLLTFEKKQTIRHHTIVQIHRD